MTHPTANVLNLTDEMKAAASLPTIERGLYVQFLVNASDDAVFQPSSEPSGQGKVLIKPKGQTLSFGSFVDGLLAFRAHVAGQMRRPPTVDSINPFSKDFAFAPKPGPYAECLKLCLVLDLSAAGVDTVAAAGEALRAAVEAFLRKEGLLVLDRSGGYCRYGEEEVDEAFMGRLEAWAKETLGGL